MKRQHSSKVLRHEQAREKYRELESSRAQYKPQQQNLRIPQPGQFFVQPTRPPKLTLDEAQLSGVRLHRPASSKCYSSFADNNQNEPEENPLGITKSIKVIVNRQNTQILSPTSKIIPQLINRRLKLRTEEGVAVRPISAQLLLKMEKLELPSIDNCELLHRAYEFDCKVSEANQRKPTSFLVKRRKRVVKHIQGYQTIELKREDVEARESTTGPGKVSRVSPYLVSFELPGGKSKGQQLNEKLPPSSAANFLPLEYYLFNDLPPEELLQRYTIQNQPIVGFSKWFYSAGSFEWKECTVDGYDKQAQRWRISWEKGQSKMVSRSNLRFASEDERTFMKNLAEAERYRNLSEVYYRYNCLIDLMKSPTAPLPELSRQRICRMVQGWASKLGRVRNPLEFYRLTFEQQFARGRSNRPVLEGSSSTLRKATDRKGLLGEIEELYARANHQIEFDSTLPFSEQRKQVFHGFLPDRMFESVLESAAPETNRKGCIQVLDRGERGFPFLQTFSRIQETAHVANAKRLAVLQQLRFRELEMESVVCWQDPGRPCSLEEFSRQWQEKIELVIHQLSIRSCDTEHEIGGEMDNYYLERRTTLDEESKRQLAQASKFQFLANHRFELMAKAIVERTLQTATSRLNHSLSELLQGWHPDELVAKDLSSYHKAIDFVEGSAADLLIRVEYRQENGQVAFLPTLQQIREVFQQRQEELISKMSEVRTIDKCYLQPARPDRRMRILSESDELLNRLRADYREAVERALAVESIFRKQVETLGRDILDYNLQARRRSLRKGRYEDFQAELKSLQERLTEIEELMLPRKMRSTLFLIDCVELRGKLRQRIYDISGEVYRLLLDRIKKDNQKIAKAIDAIVDKLRTEPTDIESMTAQLEYAEGGVNVEMEAINARIGEVMQKMDLLSAMNYRMDYADFQKSWEIYSKPLAVKQRQQKCIRNIEQYHRKQFSEELTRSHDDLLQEIQEMGWKLEKYTIYSKLTEVDVASQKFARLGERLEKAQNDADTINRREVLLKWKPTDFSDLTATREAFQPYYKVWILAKNFNCTVPTLLTGPLSSIDKKLATEEVESAYEQLSGLEKNEFKSNQRILKLVQEVRAMYGEFRQYLPLINSLRNPDLRERHWAKISEVSHVESLNEGFNGTLHDLIDSGIMSRLAQVTYISDIASRQLSYEKLFNKLKKDWRETKLSVVASEQVATVEHLDELLERVDGDMVKVQTIIGSPFVKFLEHDVVQWRNSVLFKAQEMFQLLSSAQLLWQMLYPICMQRNIEQDLPKEYLRFQSFDRSWKALTHQLSWQPMVVELVQTRVRENLQYMLDLLEQMSKGLLELFERKRGVFSRFYFLSDQEMLSIYSQSRSLEHFRLSARLCFDEVEDVIINPAGQAQAVVSASETLSLQRPVQLDKDAPLEEQLAAIDREIRHSLQVSLETTFRTGDSPVRQIAHLGNAVRWTDSTARAVVDSTLETLLLGYAARLDQVCREVRQLDEPGSPNRQRVSSMKILQLLHQRDTLNSLVVQRVTSLSNFSWQCCLRSYYSGKECLVSQMELSRKYGFEYLGGRERICITPNTDRCLRALAYGLESGQIACVKGERDTGKTATVGEFASAFGKRFVVLSCSALIERECLVKVFQGMCTSGAWVCLQHFDAVQTEVLSVLAQLVKSVRIQSYSSKNLALTGTQGIGKVKSAVIEDKVCQVDGGYALFLTSLQSRQPAVPDTLRSCIRPIGIVNPHSDAILAGLLLSDGFVNGTELAAKILSVFSACKQLIVSLGHYSFELRTARKALQKARLQAAGDEYRIVYDALVATVVPSLKENDKGVFMDILSDYFPDDQDSPKAQAEEKSNGLAILYERDGYEFPLTLKADAKQAAITIQLHRATIIIGQSMTGKSVLLEKLSEAAGSHLIRIFPKATPKQVLFGRVDASISFKQGVLSKHLKYSETGKKVWVCFDGSVDSLWAESLNPVMEDHQQLILANGEKLTGHADTRIIFETDQLRHASPSFVAKCGKVYLQTQIPPQYILSSWLSRLPKCLQSESGFYRELVKHLLEPMIQFVAATISTSPDALSLSLSPNSMIGSFLRIFTSLRLKSKSPNDIDSADSKPLLELSEAQQSEVFGVFVFAVVWSFGSVLNHHSRKAFSKEFKHLCKRAVQLYLRNIPKSSLPSDELSLFEATFDGKQWAHWLSTEPAQDHSAGHLVFTTAENLKNSFLLNLLLDQGHAMLLVGNTSSGKNASVEYFFSSLNKQRYISTLCSFGPHITLSNTLSLFERRIEKQRRSKNTVGPAYGKISVVYINDISMAARDQSGEQPSLELMRQWFTMGGWHDATGFKRVQDLAFCSSCSEAKQIPRRLMRYLNPVWSSDEEDWPKPGLRAYISHSLGRTTHVESLLKLSFSLQKIVAKEFQPRPGQEHVRFGFNETLQILLNTASVHSSYLAQGDFKLQLLKAWVNECRSSYFDRLQDEAQRSKLYYSMNNVLLEEFGIRFREVDEGLENSNVVLSLINSEKIYTATTMDSLRANIQELLKDQPYRIALSDQAIKLINRISKVLSKANGNALVVGQVGQGVYHACHLAASLLGFKILSFGSKDEEEWKETLRQCMRLTSSNQQCVLYVTAEQASELILGELNGFMKVGCFSATFSPEDIESIVSELQSNLQPNQLLDMWSEHVSLCRKNLRIVVTLNPKHANYEKHARNYSGFFDRATVVFISALQEPAIQQICRLSLPEHASCDMQAAQQFLSTINSQLAAVQPWQITRFLTVYRDLNQSRRDELQTMRELYEGAIDRLEKSALEVSELESRIAAIRTEVEQQGARGDTIAKAIELEVAKRRELAENDREKEAQLQQADKILADVRSELSSRLAVDSLNYSTVKEELRSMEGKDLANLAKLLKTASAGARLTLELLFVLAEKRRKEKDEEPWKQMISDLAEPNGKSLKKLLQLEPTSVSDKTYERLKAIADRNPRELAVAERQGKCIRVCNQLCLAVLKYCQTYRLNEPLRARAAEALRHFQMAKTDSDEAKLSLGKLNEKVRELETELMSLEERRTQQRTRLGRLQEQVVLVKATQEMFSTEVGEWKSLLAETMKSLDCVLGDSLLAAATIVFLSTLPYAAREAFRNEHLKSVLRDINIPASTLFSMAEAVPYRSYLKELYADRASSENTAIYHRSTRVSIVADPAQMFVRWVSAATEPEQLSIVRHPQQLQSNQSIHGTLLIVCNEQVLSTEWDRLLQSKKLESAERVVVVSRVPLKTSSRLQEQSTHINFQASHEGLVEYFTQCILKQEEPNTNSSDDIRRLLSESAEMRSAQRALFRGQLHSLTSCSLIALTEARDLYEKLKHEWAQLAQLNSRIKEARYAEQRLMKIRGMYDASARFAASLYIRLESLAASCPSYRVGIETYTRVFLRPIRDLEKQPQKNYKVRAAQFQKTVRRCLFERLGLTYRQRDMAVWHALFILTCLESARKVDLKVWEAIVASQPTHSELTNEQGVLQPSEIERLREVELQFKPLRGLVSDVNSSPAKWAAFFASLGRQVRSLPEPYAECDELYVLLLIRIFKPQQLPNCLASFAERLSETPETPSFDCQAIIEMGSACNPCIIYEQECLLDQLMSAAQEKSVDAHILVVASAYQAKLIERFELACQTGSWLVLQNCQNCRQAMSYLTQALDEGASQLRKIHEGFRLILLVRSQEPQDLILESLRTRSVHVRPKGTAKESILHIYRRKFGGKSDRKLYNSTVNPSKEWKKLFFSLTVFHSVLRGRRDMGWAAPFDLDLQDLDKTLRWGRLQSEDIDNYSLEWLRTRLRECLCGARVSHDESDYEVMNGLIGKFASEDVIRSNELALGAGCWVPSPDTLETIENLLPCIKGMEIDESQLMEVGSSYAKRELQTVGYLSDVLQNLQRKGEKGPASTLDISYLQSLAGPPVNMEMALKRFQLKEQEPFNTFVLAEASRFDALQQQIEWSLRRVAAYLDCQRPEPEEYESIRRNRVPEQWLRVSYYFQKPLCSYLLLFKQKLDSLAALLAGRLRGFNPGNYFNPGGAILCLQKDYCRRTVTDLSSVCITTTLLQAGSEQQFPPQHQNGIQLSGIYIHECSFRNSRIAELPGHSSFQGTQLPIIGLKVYIGQADNPKPSTAKLPLYREEGNLTALNQILQVDLESDVAPRTLIMRRARLSCEP